MAAYRRVYDLRHLQAVCQEPGSAPVPYARQSSMGYLYHFIHSLRQKISIYTLKLDGVFTIAMFPEDKNRLGRSEHTTVLNSVAESVAVVPTFV